MYCGQEGSACHHLGGKGREETEGVTGYAWGRGRQFAELGVNSNPFASKKFIGGRLDLGIAGHVCLGLGRNNMIGGNSRADCHFDLQETYATLLLDGNPILEDGTLKI